jgi:hypothetical protein
MSYGPSVDVAHHKMLSGLSRQQVSMRQTMLAQEILGKKKPPISRGLNSYGMNYLLISKPSFSKKLTNIS